VEWLKWVVIRKAAVLGLCDFIHVSDLARSHASALDATTKSRFAEFLNFTHENMDNATYADSIREITFNQAWMKQVGLTDGKFSVNSVIPPAITGLHSGDAIKGWIDNGIKYIVGDGSGPLLMNQVS
jgi:hypothetical protein